MTLWNKKPPKTLLNSFSVDHLLLGMWSTLQSGLLLQWDSPGVKVLFSYVNSYQLEIASGLGMGACVLLLSDLGTHRVSQCRSCACCLSLTELLAKWEHTNHSGYCRGYWLSTSWQQGPVAEDTPIQPTEHGEGEMVPTYSLHPYWLSILGIRKYSACYQRRNTNNSPATNALTYSDVLPAR